VNRRLGVSLTVFAGGWLWLAATYIPDVLTEGAPGPRAFPVILGVILAILGAALAVSRPAGPPPDEKGVSSRLVALGTVALLIAYAFLLDKAGFIVSTLVMMVAATAGILGMRRWILIGSLAVGFTVGCWVVFVPVLGVPLPGGTWMP
jgi:putative tricarboxylic transport membrane protein